MQSRRTSTYVEWTLWLSLTAAATWLMIGTRGNLEQAHVVLVYILIVLGAAAGGERWLGVAVAVLGFLSINYFFQRPFDSLLVDRAPDVIALGAYLAVALGANELLTRAHREAEIARRHAAKSEELSRVASEARALSEADRVKNILLTSVSHDLRTPLTAIRALAQDIAAGGSGWRDHAAIIVEQADRLGKMVADVLELSRLRAGAYKVNAELNTAEDLIGAVVRQFSAVPHAERIETVIDYTRPALLGIFDFVQSLRVLTNLIDNALRCAPARTPVVIRVTESNRRLIFEVADRGPGIPPDEQSRIFEPFYRPTSSRADVGAAGLGLSIARRLAEAQGGSVSYRDRPGGGSVFVLELPAAASEEVAESIA
jgi:two-component system sensor histidine kinase KdpD